MSIAYQLITTVPALEDFCQYAQGAGFLAVDTEFVRTRTYYARLGLVQVQAAERTALIDPVVLVNEGVSQLWRPCGSCLPMPI
ncbi:ribonuclease D [Pseudidiomarina halophila]|uniref:hypothetical protein n=1 Tax=Pseudidiomarina halophila TaxID=1449799 RepID=UPI0036120F00